MPNRKTLCAFQALTNPFQQKRMQFEAHYVLSRITRKILIENLPQAS
ncbi:MAG: hypothetical protein WAO71_08325 [Gallionella sp.]